MHALPAAGPTPRLGAAAAWPGRLTLTPIPARRFLPGDRICPGLLACDPLGVSGRTERWLAWSAPLWSRVVVKLPTEEHMDDLRVVRRLRREGRALRRLRHPAIPRLLDDAHDHPVPHLVLEHFPGATLDQVLTEGLLKPGEVLRLGMRLASCLHHVHDRGLVHLGIEPACVAVRGDQAALLDFDGMRPAGGSLPPGRPLAAAYQAPERCLREPPDPRMDLFSLGAVMYEAATGRPPFQAAGAPGGEHPQLLETAPRVRTLRPRLPLELDAAIHALLEPDPRHRPRSALEALHLLASALPFGELPAWPAFADELLERERVR